MKKSTVLNPMAGDWCTKDSLGPCICSASSPLLRHCRDCGQSKWLPACSDIHLGSWGGPVVHVSNVHCHCDAVSSEKIWREPQNPKIPKIYGIISWNLQAIKPYQIWVANGHRTCKRHRQAFCHSGGMHRTGPQNATPVNLGTKQLKPLNIMKSHTFGTKAKPKKI